MLGKCQYRALGCTSSAVARRRIVRSGRPWSSRMRRACGDVVGGVSSRCHGDEYSERRSVNTVQEGSHDSHPRRHRPRPVAVFAALIAALGLPGSFPVFAACRSPLRRSASCSPVPCSALARRAVGGRCCSPWSRSSPAARRGARRDRRLLRPTAGYALGWILARSSSASSSTREVAARSSGAPPWRLLAGGVGAIYAIGIPVQSLVTRLRSERRPSPASSSCPGIAQGGAGDGGW